MLGLPASHCLGSVVGLGQRQPWGACWRGREWTARSACVFWTLGLSGVAATEGDASGFGSQLLGSVTSPPLQ